MRRKSNLTKIIAIIICEAFLWSNLVLAAEPSGMLKRDKPAYENLFTRKKNASSDTNRFSKSTEKEKCRNSIYDTKTNSSITNSILAEKRNLDFSFLKPVSFPESFRIPEKAGFVTEIYDSLKQDSGFGIQNSERTQNPNDKIQSSNNLLHRTPYTLHDNNPLIVHIQDLHSQAEAQFNIVEILKFLDKHYSLKAILSEGAGGICDTSSVSSFPIREVKEKAASFFVKTGHLTAEEYYSIVYNPAVTIWGVEEKESYFKNLDQFIRIIDSNESSKELLKKLQKVFDELRCKLPNERLKELLTKTDAYEQGALSPADFIGYLQRKTECDDSAFAYNYPQIARLSYILAEEKKIDCRDIPVLTENLLKNLRIKFESEKRIEAKNGIVRLQRELEQEKISREYFYRMLIMTAKEAFGGTAEGADKIEVYWKYLEAQTHLDYNGIYKEIDAIKDTLSRKFAQTEEETEYLTLLKQVKFLNKFFQLKISSDEYKYFISNKDNISVGRFKDFLKSAYFKYHIGRKIKVDEKKLLRQLQEIEDFYNTAHNRDRRMADNAIEFICSKTQDTKTEDKNSLHLTPYTLHNNKPEVFVLITGGYHSAGIKSILKRNNFSYVEISPKCTKDMDDRLYYDLLKGNSESVVQLLLNMPRCFLRQPLRSGKFAVWRGLKSIAGLFAVALVVGCIIYARNKGIDISDIKDTISAIKELPDSLGVFTSQNGLPIINSADGAVKITESGIAPASQDMLASARQAFGQAYQAVSAGTAPVTETHKLTQLAGSAKTASLGFLSFLAARVRLLEYKQTEKARGFSGVVERIKAFFARIFEPLRYYSVRKKIRFIAIAVAALAVAALVILYFTGHTGSWLLENADTVKPTSDISESPFNIPPNVIKLLKMASGLIFHFVVSIGFLWGFGVYAMNIFGFYFRKIYSLRHFDEKDFMLAAFERFKKAISVEGEEPVKMNFSWWLTETYIKRLISIQEELPFKIGKYIKKIRFLKGPAIMMAGQLARNNRMRISWTDGNFLYNGPDSGCATAVHELGHAIDIAELGLLKGKLTEKGKAYLRSIGYSERRIKGFIFNRYFKKIFLFFVMVPVAAVMLSIISYLGNTYEGGLHSLNDKVFLGIGVILIGSPLNSFGHNLGERFANRFSLYITRGDKFREGIDKGKYSRSEYEFFKEHLCEGKEFTNTRDGAVKPLGAVSAETDEVRTGKVQDSDNIIAQSVRIDIWKEISAFSGNITYENIKNIVKRVINQKGLGVSLEDAMSSFADTELVLSDYDDSLVRLKKYQTHITASPETFSEIRKLIKYLHFCVISGRGHKELGQLFVSHLSFREKMSGNLHILGELGGGVAKIFFGRLMINRRKSAKLAGYIKKPLLNIIRKELITGDFSEYAENGAIKIDDKYSALAVVFGGIDDAGRRRELKDKMDAKLKPVVDAINEALGKYGKKLSYAVTPSAIDISLLDKYRGVKKLAASLKIKIEKTVIIGDSPNDIPMFRLANEGATVFCVNPAGFTELDDEPELKEKVVFVNGPENLHKILKTVRVLKEKHNVRRISRFKAFYEKLRHKIRLAVERRVKIFFDKTVKDASDAHKVYRKNKSARGHLAYSLKLGELWRELYNLLFSFQKGEISTFELFKRYVEVKIKLLRILYVNLSTKKKIFYTILAGAAIGLITLVILQLTGQIDLFSFYQAPDAVQGGRAALKTAVLGKLGLLAVGSTKSAEEAITKEIDFEDEQGLEELFVELNDADDTVERFKIINQIRKLYEQNPDFDIQEKHFNSLLKTLEEIRDDHKWSRLNMLDYHFVVRRIYENNPEMINNTLRFINEDYFLRSGYYYEFLKDIDTALRNTDKQLNLQPQDLKTLIWELKKDGGREYSYYSMEPAWISILLKQPELLQVLFNNLEKLEGNYGIPALHADERICALIERFLISLPDDCDLDATKVNWQSVVSKLKDIEQAKYLLHYLKVRGVDVPQPILDELLPDQPKVRKILANGPKKVLIVQNIADGQGDELIRNVRLISALLDFNPELEVTIYTNRKYLYAKGHPRIHIRSLKTVLSEDEFKNYSMIVNHYDWKEGANGGLNNDVMRLKEKYKPEIYIATDKDNDHYDCRTIEIDGDSRGNRRSPAINNHLQNVYYTFYKLAAELGLPFERKNTPEVVLGTSYLEAEQWWNHNVGENKKAVIVNLFGGENELKGVVKEDAVIRLINGIKNSVSQDKKVLIFANERRDDIQQALADYYDGDSRIVFMPKAGPGDNKIKGIVSRSDMVVSVEGGLTHLCAALNVSCLSLYSPNFTEWIITTVASGDVDHWFSEGGDHLRNRYFNMRSFGIKRFEDFDNMAFDECMRKVKAIDKVSYKRFIPDIEKERIQSEKDVAETLKDVRKKEKADVRRHRGVLIKEFIGSREGQLIIALSLIIIGMIGYIIWQVSQPLPADTDTVYNFGTTALKTAVLGKLGLLAVGSTKSAEEAGTGAGPEENLNLKERRQELERRLIVQALALAKYDFNNAAVLLGLKNAKMLRGRCKKYNIEMDEVVAAVNDGRPLNIENNIAALEKKLVETALTKTRGNMREAEKLVGVASNTFYKLIKDLNIDAKSFKRKRELADISILSNKDISPEERVEKALRIIEEKSAGSGSYEFIPILRKYLEKNDINSFKGLNYSKFKERFGLKPTSRIALFELYPELKQFLLKGKIVKKKGPEETLLLKYRKPRLERELVQIALKRAGCNLKSAAALLGLNGTLTLKNRCNKYGIDWNVVPSVEDKGEDINIQNRLDALEKQLMEEALTITKGNNRDAAALVGLYEANWHAKCKEHKIDKSSFYKEKPSLTLSFLDDNSVPKEKRLLAALDMIKNEPKDGGFPVESVDILVKYLEEHNIEELEGITYPELLEKLGLSRYSSLNFINKFPQLKDLMGIKGGVTGPEEVRIPAIEAYIKANGPDSLKGKSFQEIADCTGLLRGSFYNLVCNAPGLVELLGAVRAGNNWSNKELEKDTLAFAKKQFAEYVKEFPDIEKWPTGWESRLSFVELCRLRSLYFGEKYEARRELRTIVGEEHWDLFKEWLAKRNGYEHLWEDMLPEEGVFVIASADDREQYMIPVANQFREDIEQIMQKEEFSEEVRMIIDNVISEVLNNSCKYSDSCDVLIDYKITKDKFYMHVESDGEIPQDKLEHAKLGPMERVEEVSEQEHGFGIFTIISGMEMIGGKAVVKPRDGKTHYILEYQNSGAESEVSSAQMNGYTFMPAIAVTGLSAALPEWVKPVISFIILAGTLTALFAAVSYYIDKWAAARLKNRLEEHGMSAAKISFIMNETNQPASFADYYGFNKGAEKLAEVLDSLDKSKPTILYVNTDNSHLPYYLLNRAGLELKQDEVLVWNWEHIFRSKEPIVGNIKSFYEKVGKAFLGDLKKVASDSPAKKLIIYSGLDFRHPGSEFDILRTIQSDISGYNIVEVSGRRLNDEREMFIEIADYPVIQEGTDTADNTASKTSGRIKRFLKFLPVFLMGAFMISAGSAQGAVIDPSMVLPFILSMPVVLLTNMVIFLIIHEFSHGVGAAFGGQEKIYFGFNKRMVYIGTPIARNVNNPLYTRALEAACGGIGSIAGGIAFLGLGAYFNLLNISDGGPLLKISIAITFLFQTVTGIFGGVLSLMFEGVSNYFAWLDIKRKHKNTKDEKSFYQEQIRFLEKELKTENAIKRQSGDNKFERKYDATKFFYFIKNIMQFRFIRAFKLLFSNNGQFIYKNNEVYMKNTAGPETSPNLGENRMLHSYMTELIRGFHIPAGRCYEIWDKFAVGDKVIRASRISKSSENGGIFSEDDNALKDTLKAEGVFDDISAAKELIPELIKHPERVDEKYRNIYMFYSTLSPPEQKRLIERSRSMPLSLIKGWWTIDGYSTFAHNRRGVSGLPSTIWAPEQLFNAIRKDPQLLAHYILTETMHTLYPHLECRLVDADLEMTNVKFQMTNQLTMTNDKLVAEKQQTELVEPGNSLTREPEEPSFIPHSREFYEHLHSIINQKNNTKDIVEQEKAIEEFNLYNRWEKISAAVRIRWHGGRKDTISGDNMAIMGNLDMLADSLYKSEYKELFKMANAVRIAYKQTCFDELYDLHKEIISFGFFDDSGNIIMDTERLNGWIKRISDMRKSAADIYIRSCELKEKIYAMEGEQAECSKNCINPANNLLHCILGELDMMEKFSRGRMDKKPFMIEPVLEEALKVNSGREPYDIHINISEEAKRKKFYGDKLFVAQAIGELLHNIYRINGHTATVKNVWIDADTAGGKLVLKIMNDGTNLPEEKLQVDRFTGKQSLFNLNNTAGQGGTGLGTTFAEKAIADNDGYIRAYKLDDKVCFEMTLPENPLEKATNMADGINNKLPVAGNRLPVTEDNFGAAGADELEVISNIGDVTAGSSASAHIDYRNEGSSKPPRAVTGVGQEDIDPNIQFNMNERINNNMAKGDVSNVQYKPAELVDGAPLAEAIRRRFGGKTLGLYRMASVKPEIDRLYGDEIKHKIPAFDESIDTAFFNEFLAHNNISRKEIEEIYIEGERVTQRELGHIDDGSIFAEVKGRFFDKAEFTEAQEQTLKAIFERFKQEDRMIAIRCSSRFECSAEDPFDGIYDSKFFCYKEQERNFENFKEDVKMIFASLFNPAARRYRLKYNIKDEDEMAVVVQEVVGSWHGDSYYPHVSGVTQTHPFNVKATKSEVNLGMNTKNVGGIYHWLGVHEELPSGEIVYSSSTPIAGSEARRTEEIYDVLNHRGHIYELNRHSFFRENKSGFLSNTACGIDEEAFSEEFTEKVDKMLRVYTKYFGYSKTEWSVNDDLVINIYQLQPGEDCRELLKNSAPVEAVDAEHIIAKSSSIGGHGVVDGLIVRIPDDDISNVYEKCDDAKIKAENMGCKGYMLIIDFTKFIKCINKDDISSIFFNRNFKKLLGIVNTSNKPVPTGAHWSRGIVDDNVLIMNAADINDTLLNKICASDNISDAVVRMAVNQNEHKGQVHVIDYRGPQEKVPGAFDEKLKEFFKKKYECRTEYEQLKQTLADASPEKCAAMSGEEIAVLKQAVRKLTTLFEKKINDGFENIPYSNSKEMLILSNLLSGFEPVFDELSENLYGIDCTYDIDFTYDEDWLDKVYYKHIDEVISQMDSLFETIEAYLVVLNKWSVEELSKRPMTWYRIYGIKDLAEEARKTQAAEKPQKPTDEPETSTPRAVTGVSPDDIYQDYPRTNARGDIVHKDSEQAQEKTLDERIKDYTEQLYGCMDKFKEVKAFLNEVTPQRYAEMTSVEIAEFLNRINAYADMFNNITGLFNGDISDDREEDIKFWTRFKHAISPVIVSSGALVESLARVIKQDKITGERTEDYAGYRQQFLIEVENLMTAAQAYYFVFNRWTLETLVKRSRAWWNSEMMFELGEEARKARLAEKIIAEKAGSLQKKENMSLPLAYISDEEIDKLAAEGDIEREVFKAYRAHMELMAGAAISYGVSVYDDLITAIICEKRRNGYRRLNSEEIAVAAYGDAGKAVTVRTQLKRINDALKEGNGYPFVYNRLGDALCAEDNSSVTAAGVPLYRIDYEEIDDIINAVRNPEITREMLEAYIVYCKYAFKLFKEKTPVSTTPESDAIAAIIYLYRNKQYKGNISSSDIAKLLCKTQSRVYHALEGLQQRINDGWQNPYMPRAFSISRDRRMDEYINRLRADGNTDDAEALLADNICDKLLADSEAGAFEAGHYFMSTIRKNGINAEEAADILKNSIERQAGKEDKSKIWDWIKAHPEIFGRVVVSALALSVEGSIGEKEEKDLNSLNKQVLDFVNTVYGYREELKEFKQLLVDVTPERYAEMTPDDREELLNRLNLCKKEVFDKMIERSKALVCMQKEYGEFLMDFRHALGSSMDRILMDVKTMILIIGKDKMVGEQAEHYDECRQETLIEVSNLIELARAYYFVFNSWTIEELQKRNKAWWHSEQIFALAEEVILDNAKDNAAAVSEFIKNSTPIVEKISKRMIELQIFASKVSEHNNKPDITRFVDMLNDTKSMLEELLSKPVFPDETDEFHQHMRDRLMAPFRKECLESINTIDDILKTYKQASDKAKWFTQEYMTIDENDFPLSLDRVEWIWTSYNIVFNLRGGIEWANSGFFIDPTRTAVRILNSKTKEFVKALPEKEDELIDEDRLFELAQAIRESRYYKDSAYVVIMDCASPSQKKIIINNHKIFEKIMGYAFCTSLILNIKDNLNRGLPEIKECLAGIGKDGKCNGTITYIDPSSGEDVMAFPDEALFDALYGKHLLSLHVEYDKVVSAERPTKSEELLKKPTSEGLDGPRASIPLIIDYAFLKKNPGWPRYLEGLNAAFYAYEPKHQKELELLGIPADRILKSRDEIEDYINGLGKAKANLYTIGLLPVETGTGLSAPEGNETVIDWAAFRALVLYTDELIHLPYVIRTDEIMAAQKAIDKTI